MNLRAIAFAIALTFGSGVIAEAASRPVVHKPKKTKRAKPPKWAKSKAKAKRAKRG